MIGRHHCYFFLNDNKLSSRMAQISEHINSSNHKIYSHDQMSKMVVNLGSKKCENRNTYPLQLTHIQNSSLMIIVDIPEKNLSNVDPKSDMIKVCTSSVKSSSTFFCIICEMHNRVNCDQKQCLMLKSYLSENNTSIFPKRHSNNIFSEKLVNELHD